MLRVTTLYASSATATAQYYTRYLTQADGELPGQWTGHQADLLGLSGVVTTEQLESLLEGRDPISGSRLGYPLVDRVEKSGKVRRAVAGCCNRRPSGICAISPGGGCCRIGGRTGRAWASGCGGPGIAIASWPRTSRMGRGMWAK